VLESRARKDSQRDNMRPLSPSRPGIAGRGPARPGRVRVLIVDDDVAFCEMLSLYLGTISDVQLIGASHSATAALRMARQARPEVAVVDFHLPDGDAAQLARRLGQLRPPCRAIVVSAGASDCEIEGAIKAGALAYLPKDRCVRDIGPALRVAAAVVRGESGR